MAASPPGTFAVGLQPLAVGAVPGVNCRLGGAGQQKALRAAQVARAAANLSSAGAWPSVVPGTNAAWTVIVP